MHNPSRFFPLLSLLFAAACNEDQPATAPTSPAADNAASAAASHLIVNSLADPGNGVCNAQECTFREAIENAGSTTITFASGLNGTITLARPEARGGTLVIDKALSVAGPGGRVTIMRRSTDPDFRLLTVGTDGIVSLTNLNLRNGKTDRPGAGIINFGTLTLTQCSVTGNTTTQHGGGIDNHGPLTLNNSTVAQNSAGSGGGGLDNHSTVVKLTNSSVTDNSGSGIFNGGGRLQMTGGEVSRNSLGGIQQNFGKAFLNRIKIVGNSSSGIINRQGVVSLANSTVSLNSSSQGAGVFNSAGGFVSVVGSTISNNSASELGGGIHNTVHDPFGRLSAGVEVINSTVSGNSAPVGGGIENSNFLGGADVTVVNSTIARNSASSEGGGVRNEDTDEDADQSNSVFLINSLVALNTAPSAPDAAAVGARFSLIGDGSGSGLTNTNGNQVGKVSPHITPIDPKLGLLANNGGSTKTHALLAGSPALDAASTTDCPTKDQRGVPRPQGAGCDIGSYEK